MHSFLNYIYCTWIPRLDRNANDSNIGSHTWSLDYIFDNKENISANNPISKGGKIEYSPGVILPYTTGIRLSKKDNSEKHIIKDVEGLIFIDIDNHEEKFWSIKETKSYIKELHKQLIGQTGYICSELSKSGTGIHIIFYIPIDKKASIDEQYKQYYVNSALTYNKIYNQLKKILGDKVSEEDLLKDVLDFHNLSLGQPFALGSRNNDNTFFNDSYASDCDIFKSYCENFPESYKDYDDYLKALDRTKVHPVIVEKLYKKLGVYTNQNQISIQTNYKLNDFNIDEFKRNIAIINPANNITFDYNYRLQLVWTLRNFFSEEETIEIAKTLYNRFHNSDSKKSNAYSNIKSASKDTNKTPNPQIISYLKQFGFSVEQEIQSLPVEEQGTDKDFWGIEGTLINGNKADETIYLENGYLSDHLDTILQRLQEHRNLYIKAGCGTGKSTFYKNLLELKGKNVCIVCHLNSIIDGVYGERTSKVSNSDDIFDISNDSIIQNFNADAATVNTWIKSNAQLPGKMVISWNSYQKLLEAKYDTVLADYIKCFDESHNLIEQLDFRNNAAKGKQGLISCLLDPRWHFKNTIFCSGTPQYEYEFMEDMWKIEFLKKDPVKYSMQYIKIFSNCKFARSANYQAANLFINWFLKKDFIHDTSIDKILLFSNKLHKHLAEGFEMKGVDICDFSKDNKDTMESQALIHNKNLNQRVFFSTIYGGQGIEIKNDIENLLCVFMKGDATRTDIIQAVHRFRSVKKIHIIIVETDPLPLTKEDTLKPAQAILRALGESDEYKKKQNYFATKTLFRNNIGYESHDIKLAQKFHDYKKNEYVEYETIKDMFSLESQIPVSMEEIVNNDVTVRISEEQRMKYEKFFTDNVHDFFEYRGILAYDRFLGEISPGTNAPTAFWQNRIERDLLQCRLLKDMLTPTGEEYSDVDLTGMVSANIEKIIKLWTLPKIYKEENAIIGIENIFRIDKAYECLTERKRINKHYISSGSYLKPIIDDEKEINKLIDIRQNYLKLAGEVKLDGVTENMYKQFADEEKLVKLDETVIENLKKPTWLTLDSIGESKPIVQKRIGKNRVVRKKVFSLITNPEVVYYSLQDCLNFCIAQGLVNVGMKLKTFQNNHWKKFFKLEA